MKKHHTHQGEQSEVLVSGKKAENNQSYEPNKSELGIDHLADELSSHANPPEEPPLNPGSLS